MYPTIINQQPTIMNNLFWKNIKNKIKANQEAKDYGTTESKPMKNKSIIKVIL